jgi:hypothetical protein
MKKLNLDAKTKKALAIEKAKQEKEAINNSKVSNILDADLDNKSLMTELAKLTIPEKRININQGMFRFDSLIVSYNSLSKDEQKKKSKQIRKKARNKRNFLLTSICKDFKEGRTKELKQTIKDFNSFYKEYYLLNDLSLNSIARSSSDKDKLILFALALQIVKNNK